MRVVEQVLERRQALARRPRSRFGTLAALALHGLALAAIIVAPMLRSEEKAPAKFVTAQIVPLQALGRPEPPPKPPPRRRAPPPPPAVEPLPQQPKPQPAAPPPPDPDIPTLPDRSSEPAEPAPPVQAPAPAPPVRQGSERGNARGTAAFGAAVASLDNPDFTYSYYIDRMVALIRARWNRPPTAGEVESAVHFRILRDGTIREVELRNPSGDPAFDRAALKAVQEASPLPPLPVGYRQDSLGVNLLVR